MRQSRISESGREVLPDVREWSGGPPRCLGMVRMPSQMSESGRVALLVVQKALPDVREWSRGPSECQRVIGTPAQMSRSGRETLPNIRKALLDNQGFWLALPYVQEWSGGTP